MKEFFLSLLVLVAFILFCSFLSTIQISSKLNKNPFCYIKYSLKNNYLDKKYKKYLIDNLHKSKYYGKSGYGDLNKSVFNAENVYGFSIAFKKEYLDCVKNHLPYLAPYLDNIILPNTNSYYINYLVIKNGKKIGTHIDDTLLRYFKSKDTINAKYVTVLYLIIDQNMIGGELKIKGPKDKWTKKKHKKTKWIIKPKDNLLVLFDGNLYHAVNGFKSDSVRASLVCEQYELTKEELDSMDGFTIHSQKTDKKIKIC